MKKTILAVLTLLFLQLHGISFSQVNIPDSLIAPSYKNAVKAMPILLPFVGVAVYTGLSVGYERFIK